MPTLFAALLASPELPARGALKLRRCTSAGEALPADIGRRWTEHFGVEILDGMGSTEMLHIFLSNRPGDVRYGTSGTPVPGYELRILGDDGAAGRRPARSASCRSADRRRRWATGTTARRAAATFQGPWTRSGDKYSIDADGYYVYAGRSDDMLKVGGIYVSPIEVESALITHPAVLEAAVIGKEDDEHLDQARRLRGAERRQAGFRRAGGGAAPAREDAARAVEISALDRVHRRAAEDGDG